VRVTTGVDRRRDPVIALWLVATTDPAAAIATVWDANPLALKVEVSKRLVQPGTVKRLRLRPG
jgi:hypothetical protein